MNLTYTAHLELPAGLEITRALLSDSQIWPTLPIGAARHGELWQRAGELYRVVLPEQNATQPNTLRWSCLPVVGSSPRLDLALHLSDAQISTHVQLQLQLSLPGAGWPWRRVQVAHTLHRIIEDCRSALAQALRAQPQPAYAMAVTSPAPGIDAGEPLDPLARRALIGATPAQRALVEQLAPRYPLTVEHFLAIGALDHLERVARLEQGWERIMRGEYDERVHQVVAGGWGPGVGGWGAEQSHMQTQDIAALSAPDSQIQTQDIAPLPAPTPHPPTPSYDLIYAGGGLGLLHAVVMATCYGRRVLVFDRGEVGCAHREWNISRAELQALVDLGVATWDELGDVVMREYRDGVVRFHNRPGSDVATTEIWMPEVLNVALDAGALLRLMRRKLEAAGGQILSGRAFRTVRVSDGGPMWVEVELEQIPGGAAEHYRARLLLDGMGSTSPLALRRHAGRPFAGVCPTVGTVAAGFVEGDGPDEHDPTIGDILVSVADAQRGEQLMWEGFPGRHDELTVYLFYYSTIATAGELQPGRNLRADSPRYSLLDLFEQYFTLLPTYKRPGPHFRHLKPVYGYIPARHSLRPQEAPLLRGVLPVGDSAAQQSPLTFCGFGSHVRNLRRSTGLLDHALRRELLEPEQLACINAFQTNVSLNWVFSRFMHPWSQAHDVNRLQNIFLAVLNDLGVDIATRFFQDRMRWADYHPMILGMLRRYPLILAAAWRVLRPEGMLQWAGDYLRFTRGAMAAALARAAGAAGERAATRLSDRLAPALGLRVRARYAEWRAMDWM